jgi:hypothetical protein
VFEGLMGECVVLSGVGRVLTWSGGWWVGSEVQMAVVVGTCWVARAGPMWVGMDGG